MAAAEQSESRTKPTIKARAIINVSGDADIIEHGRADIHGFIVAAESSDRSWTPAKGAAIDISGPCWAAEPRMMCWGRIADGEFVADAMLPSRLGAKVDPNSILETELFSSLSSRNAQKVVKQYGAAALRILADSPQEVGKWLGMSDGNITRLASEARKAMACAPAWRVLLDAGARRDQAAKIIEAFGEDAIVRLVRNPYDAVDVPDVGFKTGQAIAKAIGVPEDSHLGMRKAVELKLQQALENGSTAVRKKDMVAHVGKACGNAEAAHQYLSNATDGFASHPTDQGEIIVPASLASLESSIARRLSDMRNWPCTPLPGMDWSTLGFKPTDDQVSAVRILQESHIGVLTGGPGTGKTTILKALAGQLEAAALRDVAFVAPTGKAARRLSEACGQQARTLHQLLGAKLDGTLSDERLPLQALVIDEASMLDCRLFSHLLQVLPRWCRIVLCGDPDQLPPFGAGAVLSDILASGCLPRADLRQCMRQADNSPIISASQAMRDGRMPDFRSGGAQLALKALQSEDEVAAAVVRAVTEIMPKAAQLKPGDVQVLTARKAGPAGMHKLNLALKDVLNPSTDDNRTVTRFGRSFTLGDRVIWMRNDYRMGLRNGDVGHLSELNWDRQEALIDFGDGESSAVPFDKMKEVDLAYALTVHRSQGSEYPAIIMPVPAAIENGLSRELLYTALTRGKRNAWFVGSPKAMESGLSRSAAAQRTTRLAHEITASMPPMAPADDAFSPNLM